MTQSWQLFAMASALSASLTTILMKVGVSGVNSNFATLLRTISVVVISLLMVFFRNEWPQEKINYKVLAAIILSGITTGISWLCFYKALQLGDASKVAAFDKLSVVMTILLSLIFLGEKFDATTAIGGLLILSGSLILALK